jgi:polysaccharide export outer membrane protein
MRLLAFALLMFFLIYATPSCVSYKQILNYQTDYPDSTQMSILKLPDIRIQPNDVLGIKVFSTDMELAAPFNVTTVQQNSSFASVETIQLNGYLVSQEGAIDLPILGSTTLKGLSVSAAKEFISEKLKQYLKDPVVNVRLLNFRVTVSGEVRRPGAYNIFNERVSLPDALAMAGDLTDHASRKDILLVRENNGIRSLNRINLQSAAFFQSDLYYLRQNDMIYIKPLKAKAGAIQDQSSKASPIIAAAATLAAVLIALFK